MRRYLGLWIILCFGLVCCGRGEPATVANSFLPLNISAPISIIAGDELTITAGSTTWEQGDVVRLVLLGSDGPHLYTTTVASRNATFNIPATDTQVTGYVSVFVQSDTHYGESQLTIYPAAPVDPVTPLVGARTIIADGDHWAMVVIIPFDQFGNPLADNSPVEIRTQHPNNWLELDTIYTTHLLAWKRVWSGTKAGKTIIAATVGEQYGPSADLLEIPGWPMPFTLSVDPSTTNADGRRQLDLRTSIITDKFGNVLPDGTLVTFVVYEGDDLSSPSRSLPGYLIDGTAIIPLQSPQTPTSLTIIGTVLGVVSDSLTVPFGEGPAVDYFPVRTWLAPEDGELVIEAGPLLGELTQYVPDGTEVTFIIVQNKREITRKIGIADAGYATMQLRVAILPPGDYQTLVSAGSGKGIGLFTIPAVESETSP